MQAFPCSVETLEELEFAARRHWGAESRLRWTMDCVLQEDGNKAARRSGAAALQAARPLRQRSSCAPGYSSKMHQCPICGTKWRWPLQDAHGFLRIAELAA
jgi:hypothetical protein